MFNVEWHSFGFSIPHDKYNETQRNKYKNFYMKSVLANTLKMAGTFRKRPLKAVIWQAQNQFVEAWVSAKSECTNHANLHV